MKLSCRKNSRSYRPDYSRYRAYLNGELVEHAFEADEEKGRVRAFRTDGNDHFILDKRKKRVLSKTLYGKVEIREVEKI